MLSVSVSNYLHENVAISQNAAVKGMLLQLKEAMNSWQLHLAIFELLCSNQHTLSISGELITAIVTLDLLLDLSTRNSVATKPIKTLLFRRSSGGICSSNISSMTPVLSLRETPSRTATAASEAAFAAHSMLADCKMSMNRQLPLFVRGHNDQLEEYAYSVESSLQLDLWVVRASQRSLEHYYGKIKLAQHRGVARWRVPLNSAHTNIIFKMVTTNNLSVQYFYRRFHQIFISHNYSSFFKPA